MTFQASHAYRGGIKLAVLDWAGTTVDYGCYAPAVAFVEVFKRHGVAISMAQARKPMGLGKRDHIRAISLQPAVAEEWQRVHGRPVQEQDIDALYVEFQPIQMECLAEHADLIPGTLEAVAALRAQGIRIGTTSGYFTEAMELLQREAAQRGYVPDSTVCASQVQAARPAPWMVFQNMLHTGVYPPAAVVKVDDTTPGIQEGLNAGSWAVGLAKTGNELGLSLAEVDALPAGELSARLEHARRTLREAGAHYVIDSIAGLPDVVADINRRLGRGEYP